LQKGCGRSTEPEFARFLKIGLGSASEVQYQLLLSRDLNYINNLQFQRLDKDISEVKRMLTGLIQRIMGALK